MDHAAAELFLASLFVEETPERLEVLRNAAQAAKSWEGLVASLEGHGLLGLFLHNLERAGIEQPPALAPTLQARLGAQRQEEQRAHLALTRFLAAAARERIEVTLVGGSALCFGVVATDLRRRGEPELFVSPEHAARAVAAAAEAGLLLDESALPAWWHRHTGLPLALRPSSPMLGTVHLTSTLHHPSLLLTAREPEVLGRRKRVAHEGHALFLLDPLDGLLDLAVRLAMRAGETLLVSGRRNVLVAARSSTHPLRLGQLLDVRTHIERSHTELTPAAVLERAREWSAAPALGAVLECIQMGLGFLPGAREWARQVTHGAASTSKSGPGGNALALFRPDPIERLPQWLAPSDAYLARRYGLERQPKEAAPRALRLARARHLGQVLGACAFAGLGFPAALLARRLARKARRTAWAAAHRPERMSDVAEAFKSAARVEQMKPLTPHSIALPTSAESVSRFPDHYR